MGNGVSCGIMSGVLLRPQDYEAQGKGKKAFGANEVRLKGISA